MLNAQIPTEPPLSIDELMLVTYLAEEFSQRTDQPAGDLELARGLQVKLAAMMTAAQAYAQIPAPEIAPAAPMIAVEGLVAVLTRDGFTPAQIEGILRAPGSPFAHLPDPGEMTSMQSSPSE